MFKKRKPKRAREEFRKESTQKETDIVEDVGEMKEKTVAQLKKSLTTSENTLHSFGSSKSATPTTYGGGATSTLDIHTDIDRDARAIHERNLKLKEERAANISKENGTKLYQGKGAYLNPLEKTAEQLAKAKQTGTMGPLRAPSNLRATSRFDYQPDICKDYKETGFCGYGDNCKFMHDRSNYKAGWQIEKEWEAEQRKKKARLARGDKGTEANENDKDNPLTTETEKPFACFICRNQFTKPVVTKCKHYFCQKCALQYYSTSPKCAACGKPTGGIFNKASI